MRSSLLSPITSCAIAIWQRCCRQLYGEGFVECCEQSLPKRPSGLLPERRLGAVDKRQQQQGKRVSWLEGVGRQPPQQLNNVIAITPTQWS